MCAVAVAVVPMAMMVMSVRAAAEQPRARRVYEKAEHRDRDGLGKAYRHRGEEAAHGLIANQQRNHCEDDSAREPGQVAKLAGPEGEARIVLITPGGVIGERREQHGPGMRAHMKPVRDQGN